MTGAADIQHLLGGAMLVLALLMLGQRRMEAAIGLYALQSAALALLALAVGWVQGRFGLWLVAGLLLGVQAGLIPAGLRRVAHADRGGAGGGPAAMAAGVVVVVLAILAVRGASLPPAMAREDLAASLSVMALGLLTSVARPGAIGWMLGLLTASSGCTLAALTMPGLPVPLVLLAMALLAAPLLGGVLLQRRAAMMDAPP